MPHLPPETVTRILKNVERVIRGKPGAVEQVLIGLLAGGHVLIEDIPGVGKTTLARALAKSIRGSFRRIQFTPDLLPSDILGVSVWREPCGDFVFQPGPLFASIVLADEINRATPRTQSSLLEAMNDRQVTVDGKTHPLEAPFMVIATQNPVEAAGTYPLPDSQMDRFLLRVSLGYPDRDAELEILFGQQKSHPLDAIEPVAEGSEIAALQDSVRGVKVSDGVAAYVVAIAEATRRHDRLLLGASPRASIALFRGAQARALVRGREFVLPDDVKQMSRPVLGHRLVEKDAFGKAEGRHTDRLVQEIVDSVPVPL
jgi:MoxR-like ATPase